MTIWLKVSDAFNGLTAVHGGTVDAKIDVDSVLEPGAEEKLYELCRDFSYSENPPGTAVRYLRSLGWTRAPALDRDNGYVSAAAFTKERCD